MAISAYIGLQGSGKSYSIMENVILPAVNDGREVWTNIPMCRDSFEEAGLICPISFTIDDIKNTSNWFFDVLPKGVLIVIDEVQKLWPSGLKSNQVNPGYIDFLTEHRHLVGENGRSTEIILATQRLSLIASFAKATIEKTIISNNLAIVGKPKSYRSDIYPGAITSDRPNQKNKVREIYGSYKPEIYKFYISHTQSEGGVGDESRIDKRLNIFSGWKLKIFALSIILCVTFAAYFGYRFLTKFGHSKDTDIKSDHVPVTYTVAEKVNYSKPSLPKDTFLGEATSIYISLNIGKYPKINYLFRVIYKGGSVDLNIDQLMNLGYQIKPFDSCLVKIFNSSFEKYVLCEKLSDPGLIQNLVSSTTE